MVEVNAKDAALIGFYSIALSSPLTSYVLATSIGASENDAFVASLASLVVFLVVGFLVSEEDYKSALKFIGLVLAFNTLLYLVSVLLDEPSAGNAATSIVFAMGAVPVGVLLVLDNGLPGCVIDALYALACYLSPFSCLARRLCAHVVLGYASAMADRPPQMSRGPWELEDRLIEAARALSALGLADPRDVAERIEVARALGDHKELKRIRDELVKTINEAGTLKIGRCTVTVDVLAVYDIERNVASECSDRVYRLVVNAVRFAERVWKHLKPSRR